MCHYGDEKGDGVGMHDHKEIGPKVVEVGVDSVHL